MTISRLIYWFYHEKESEIMEIKKSIPSIDNFTFSRFDSGFRAILRLFVPFMSQEHPLFDRFSNRRK